MTDTFVVAGTIARDRVWALPAWHRSLHADATRKPDATYVLLNDCSDDSYRTLKILRCRTVPYHFGPDCGTDRVGPNRYSMQRLAHLRNVWIDDCFVQWPHLTHLFSCDSDVLPDPNVLSLLLAADKPVIAAVVRNGPGPVYNFFCGDGNEGDYGRLHRDGTEGERLDSLTAPFRVTMTGACCLYRRDAIDSGLRFHAHDQGEDVGLAIQAKELGIELWVHPQARTSHMMCQGEEPLRP